MEHETFLHQYYIEHDHDPIIPKEIFDEVQNCRRSRKRAGESHTLFANQLYCSECGSAYGPRRWHSTTQNDTVWECIYSYRNGRCCSSPHLYKCLLIPIFRGMVNGLLERHSDVWVECIVTLSQYMDDTSFSSNGIGTILQEGKPSCTERMLWQIIFPKVLVYPKNILIFHVVDGNEIRYQMRRTISIDSYTSPVNAGADEIRDTAVMVLFQGKEFSLSKPERENSSINMVCSHPQLGSPLCGSCRRLRGCRCV